MTTGSGDDSFDPAGAARAFRELTGCDPEGVWSAPGRVNLIGEHTDYNGGSVLPFAIHLRTAIAAGRRRDGWLRAVSLQSGGELSVPVGSLVPGSVDGWGRYVAGTVWALGRAGYPLAGGFDLVIDGAVPAGSGLSSSAALECAVATALADLTGAGGGAGAAAIGSEDRAGLARLAQAAENDFVGVPCGLMDQMVSMAATAGHALHFDVGSGRIDQIPFDPAGAGLTLLVADSRVGHAHADGGYRDRRDACARAARILGVDALGDVDPADLDVAVGRLDEVLGRRVRHVVTEQARTAEAARLLRAGRLADIGRLLDESHRSLRDDFEVSTPELDALAAAARQAGALGARLTGGGFGGSVLALVPSVSAAAVSEAMSGALRSFAGPAVPVMAVIPSDGARRDLPVPGCR